MTVNQKIMESKLIDISIRDYLAAQAMQGLCANPEFIDMTNEKTCQWAYQMADAMLEKMRDEEVIKEARQLDKRIEDLKSPITNQKLKDILMDCVDKFGVASKAAQADKRAWEHLLVYAPLNVRFNTNNPNRHPHADMIHEWAETGRKVESYDKYNEWEYDRCPRWEASGKFRWADEQTKPDVEIYIEAVLQSEMDGVAFYQHSKEGCYNCKFTFDADGKLKDVEMLK